MSQEGCEIIRESVPYVKLDRYNQKHLYVKLKNYGDHGNLKVGHACFPRTVASVTPYTSTAQERQVHIPVGKLVRAEKSIANGGGHFEQVM